jgi:hypothetical protein
MWSLSRPRLIQQGLANNAQYSRTGIVGLLVSARVLLKLEHLELLLGLGSGVGDRRVNQRSDSGREFCGLDAERVGELEDLGLNVTTTANLARGGTPFALSYQPECLGSCKKRRG